MRRHAAYWLGIIDQDDDPYDELWELHKKYNLVDSSPEQKKPHGQGLCTKAKQVVIGSYKSISNFKLSGI